MKILAQANSSTFICEVKEEEEEVQKFMNTYYNKGPRMEVGQVIDLGRGYDYLSDIRYQFAATQDFVNRNKSVVDAILNGLQVLASEQQDPAPTLGQNND